MPTVEDIARQMETIAPLHLAEDWDNVGLLVGHGQQPVRRLMTCLTVTPASASEAIQQQADLIVTHHPMPFRELKRLTNDNTPGRLLLDLIEHRVAVYSPHTAFDSALQGINQQLASGLGLEGVTPLRPLPASPASEAASLSSADSSLLGAGRYGRLPESATLADVAEKLKRLLQIDHLQFVGDRDRSVQTVAVACGAAGEFLTPARRLGCDVLITGETNFHTCLEAEATGVALILIGHYASERFAVEQLATVLAQAFADIKVWPSTREADPLTWI